MIDCMHMEKNICASLLMMLRNAGIKKRNDKEVKNKA